VVMFNITFNNISVISWRSVLLVEETGVSGENHRHILSQKVVSSTPRHDDKERKIVSIAVNARFKSNLRNESKNCHE
jgi:hypothetical protein